MGVAAFDFDGTLIPGDSLRPFLIRVLGYRRFVDTITAAGPSMVAEYRRGGRDAAKLVLLRRALQGRPARDVLIEGEQFGQELVSKLRSDMADRLRWHRARGHRLILVSASLAAYLEPLGRHVGFDQVIATRLAVDDDGLFSGALVGANVRGQEKADRLRGALASDDVELWAYGNSSGDRELLAMADHPVWVRPKLAETARGWLEGATGRLGQPRRSKRPRSPTEARPPTEENERAMHRSERSGRMD